jgi:hypothetical protein
MPPTIVNHEHKTQNIKMNTKHHGEHKNGKPQKARGALQLLC